MKPPNFDDIEKVKPFRTGLPVARFQTRNGWSVGRVSEIFFSNKNGGNTCHIYMSQSLCLRADLPARTHELEATLLYGNDLPLPDVQLDEGIEILLASPVIKTVRDRIIITGDGNTVIVSQRFADTDPIICELEKRRKTLKQ